MGNKANLFKMKPGMHSISGWVADKYSYKNMLAQDRLVYNFFEKISKKLNLEIAEVNVYTNKSKFDIVLHTSKPGLLLGKTASNIDFFKKELSKILQKPVDQINIQINTIYNPESNANIVAMKVAQDIERRKSCNTVIKNYMQESIKAGVLGIKIKCGGRINGADIASTIAPPGYGRVSRHTIRANIDYAAVTARTQSGALGVKVWINKSKQSGQERNFTGFIKKRSSNINKENVKLDEGVR